MAETLQSSQIGPRVHWLNFSRQVGPKTNVMCFWIDHFEPGESNHKYTLAPGLTMNGGIVGGDFKRRMSEGSGGD